MTRKKSKKTPTEKNELSFAVAIARGESVAQAAKTAKISLASGYRWARKSEVRKAVEDVRSSVVQAASHRIIGILDKAVDALEKLLGSESEKTRLAAARTVIDAATKMRQLAELEQELEQIRTVVATLRQQQAPPR